MEHLISLYQERLNLKDATFSRIEHDDAMVAIVYKVTQSDGVQLALKICPRSPDYKREIYFLNYFKDSLPVPEIIEVVQPEPNIHGAILMEYLPGALLTIADITDKLAYQIGSILADIHSKNVIRYGDLIEPDTLSHDPRAYFCLKFEEGFAECSNHLPLPLLEKCRIYYDKHLDLLTSVDGPRIVHRDFRPGNIIVNQGELQGIIDWASARASFAEEDLCTLEHDNWNIHPAYKKSFLAGYASIRPIPNYLAILPLLRLSKAFATLGFLIKTGTWNNKHATLYKLNRHFLETFL